MSVLLLFWSLIVEDDLLMCCDSPSAHSWAVKKAFDVEVYDGHKRA